MKFAYFDCFSGVSGDMTLAALVSAGWAVEELQALPARLKLEHVSIDVTPVRRGAFAATRVEVRAPAQQQHRHLRHIEAILDAAELGNGVRARAKEVFRRLAAAEAEVHGTTIQAVHFHEVGAVDAIVDIVGALVGLDALGVEKVYASTLPLGGGTVLSEHGRIPVPAPATVNLLRGVPVVMGPVEAELVTPTGAALLVTLVEQWGPPPEHRMLGIGTGAGSRDFPEHANVLRLMIGETAGAGRAGRRVDVLETAIDDENPQFLAEILPRLLEQGALDVMLAPVQMKKGRQGTWLIVVSEPSKSEHLARVILAETSSLGVRIRAERRIELERRLDSVETSFGPVLVKVALLPGGVERPHPEFETVREASRRSGAPFRDVSEAAILAWRVLRGGSGSHSGPGEAPQVAPAGPGRRGRRGPQVTERMSLGSPERPKLLPKKRIDRYM